MRKSSEGVDVCLLGYIRCCLGFNLGLGGLTWYQVLGTRYQDVR